MKSTTLLILLLVFCLSATYSWAQLGMDSYLLSVDLNLSSSTTSTNSTNDISNNSYDLGTSIAYVKNDHIMYGLGFRFMYNRIQYDSNFITSLGAVGSTSYRLSESRRYSIAPQLYVAYYQNIGAKFFWSIPVALQYKYFKNISTYDLIGNPSGVISEFSDETKQQSYVLRASPTFRYQLFKKLGLQVVVGEVAFEHVFKNNIDKYDLFSFSAHMNWSSWRFGVFTSF